MVDLTKLSNEELIDRMTRMSDLQDAEQYQLAKAEILRRLNEVTT